MAGEGTIARGRKALGPRKALRMEGSDEAKRRLRVILETIAGRWTVADACRELGISEARFHQLRDGALKGALGALEPGPVGRPPGAQAEEDGRLAALEAEVKELRIDLRASQIREEIAAVMPHLLKPREDAVKKTALRNSSQELFGKRRSEDGRRPT